MTSPNDAAALSDMWQRFPQWYITPAEGGWQAIPRATWLVEAPTLAELRKRLEREEARREGATGLAVTAQALRQP